MHLYSMNKWENFSTENEILYCSCDFPIELYMVSIFRSTYDCYLLLLQMLLKALEKVLL